MATPQERMDQDATYMVQKARERGASDAEISTMLDGLYDSFHSQGVTQGFSDIGEDAIQTQVPLRASLEERKQAKIPNPARFDMSFGDTPEEKMSRFKEQVPGGEATVNPETGEPLYKMPGQSQYVPEKFMQSSTGAFASQGRELPRVGGSVAAALATGGTSIPLQALSAGAGYLGGGLMEEAGEWLQGEQQETPKDIAKREGAAAAKEAVFDLAGGLAFRHGVDPIVRPWLQKKFEQEAPGVLRFNQTPEDRAEAKYILDFQEQMAKEGKEPVDLPRFLVPGTDTATGKVLPEQLQSVGMKQIDRTTGRLTRQSTNAIRQMSDNAEELAKMDNALMGEDVTDVLETSLARQKGAVSPEVPPEKGGAAMTDTAQDWKRATKRKANLLYGQMDEAAKLEKPEFDITPVQTRVGAPPVVEGTATVPRVTDILDESGNPVILDEIREINVRENPPAALNQLESLIAQLDPKQTDYRVIKELRTRLGNIARTGVDSSDTGVKQTAARANELYFALDDVAKNPVGDAPAFQRAAKEAGDYYASRQSDLVHSATQDILNNEAPASLLSRAVNTGDVITPKTHLMLREMAQTNPQRAEDMRQALRTKVLYQESQGAGSSSYNRVLDLKQNNSEMYEMMGGDEMLAKAQEWDTLMSSPSMQVFRKGSRASSVVPEMIKAAKDPADLRKLVQDMGGKGSEGHNYLRQSTVTDLLNTSRVQVGKGPGRSGEMQLNYDALTKNIAKLKKSGAWDSVLTKEDRVNMEGFSAMLRSLAKSAGADVGASLEAAQLFSRLKKPTSTLFALAEITQNNVLAAAILKRDGMKQLRKIAYGQDPLEAKLVTATQEILRPVAELFYGEEPVEPGEDFAREAGVQSPFDLR